MQTKNINVEQAPLNNVAQKLLPTTQQKNHIAAAERQVPPLPPRAAIIFTPLPELPNGHSIVEVEGYGPYKPVPPPKPLQQQQQQQNANTATAVTSFTPPPYRMPPYPLYSEPSIPGATAGLDSQTVPSATSTPQGLHTHSSKFPIEREVILSSGDKNSKIPILNEYKKRSKVAIAPDVPPKQMAAWTQGQQPIGSDMQNHSGIHVQTSQLNVSQNTPDHNVLYRASYHTPHEYLYNGQNASSSTGAVPRTTQQWQESTNKPIPNRQHQPDEQTNGTATQSVLVTIESTKDAQKNSKSITKSYHTLKDMISSRFKSGKDSLDLDKPEEIMGLNNVAEELRKSVRSVDRLTEETEERNGGPNIAKKVVVGEQSIYGKPRIEQRPTDGALSLQQQQHQYNQHLIQQQMLQQQQMIQNQQALQQQYQQQLKTQQQYSQLVQTRSQEILTPRSHQPVTGINQDAAYYHGVNYGVTPQRPPTRYGMQQTPDQTYVMMHHPQFGEVKVSTRDIVNERCVDDRHQAQVEPRSPQQIERDNIRRKSFEARRAASQPQLYDEDNITTRNENGTKLLNQVTPMRRGSHGNLIESCKSRGITNESEKDSDDGGFITRTNGNDRKLDMSQSTDNIHYNDTIVTISEQDSQKHESESMYGKDDSKVIESLIGTPRKRLEGEIGKIEGVYNVGQRIRALNGENIEIGDKRGSHRKPNGSGASSDYDKQGGQSSNADSGRGSAAYSSGRRVGNDTSTESSDTHQLPSTNYRESTQLSGHDTEWVDIVENELRHILEPKLHELSLQGNNVGVANSTVSESISSMTPPLPPLSPGEGSSPNVTPRNSSRYKHNSLPYGSKPEYGMDTYNKPSKGALGPGVGSTRWHGVSSQKHRSGKKLDHISISKSKQIFGIDTTDITSTTTRSLDLESMLDGQSDSDGDISTTDARAIRKQLEGLETMYSEVLKLLGVKKHSGRYQPSDPRFSKRRYGSMSSLPSSSVSSRPIRDKRRAHDERKKVKDIRGINKRFQRLESHVVTLARSVAHLSSEMRTQHLMIQEMENIRGEISALRTQTNMLNIRSQSAHRGPSGSKDLPSLANPTRVRKLTKFFGDEPPLLRLFLKKLGYEKYANVFENERVGMVELPYMSEDRLQKMGVPLGPRLRIMQEAQISVCKEQTLCIV